MCGKAGHSTEQDVDELAERERMSEQAKSAVSEEFTKDKVQREALAKQRAADAAAAEARGAAAQERATAAQESASGLRATASRTSAAAATPWPCSSSWRTKSRVTPGCWWRCRGGRRMRTARSSTQRVRSVRAGWL